MKKKLVRAEFEYEDGSVSKLVGDEADKWDTAMGDVMFCYQNHDNIFPKFDWIVIRKNLKGKSMENQE